ncbi:DUF3068 domain-containing protein [Streptomyces sp. JJ66]|uniref:DUF3068 domain-containing protein n=1 Tax=Streptomyces sp. JJ66 TaxID=2803843 RepID=UPI001C572D28|nr:DUF3068 domain-containing protein [Streptomyces sp. JJ66]MBW1600964.1 DUF3068 domain-containing protein [Streptomyces sp. JJ66]
MRRSASPLSLTLLGLGVFLLVLAPMLAFYVEPRAKRTPVDVNTTTVMTGTGTYFDRGSVSAREDQELTVTRRVLGNVAVSTENDVAVWDVSVTIDTPDTLKLDDPRKSFQWTTERWVTDRETNKPVHCCDEAPTQFSGDAYLKFPFDVRERSYRWWDNTLGDTVTMEFDKRVKLDGYEGLRFTGEVAPTQVDTRQVPGVLVGVDAPQVMAEEWYANENIELVVDETTGRILKATSAPDITLRAPGGEEPQVTLLYSDALTFTDETIESQIDLASADSRKLRLVGTTAPVGAAIAGVVLTGAGGFLVVRGRREPQP